VQYDKLKASNRFAMMVYASTAVLTIWIPYIALSINVAVWILWFYLSLIEKE